MYEKRSERYIFRAKEVFTIALNVKDVGYRRRLMQVALEYLKMAESAKQIEDSTVLSGTEWR